MMKHFSITLHHLFCLFSITFLITICKIKLTILYIHLIYTQLNNDVSCNAYHLFSPNVMFEASNFSPP